MKRAISKPLGTKDEGLPLGGPGSGNWGHAGRKGKRGGSASDGVVVSITGGRDAIELTETILTTYEEKKGDGESA